MRRRLTSGGWVAVATTAMVIGSSLTAYGAYYDIYGNISQENIDTDAFGDRPTKVDGAVNIMVIGSDVRTGDNANYGTAEGERPDTLVIAHLSPERNGATLVNLPRDSLVALPDCPATETKPGQSAHTGMIGEAMNNGGVQCLWKTVEQLTGVHIDHFVSVDFTGFKGMVDSLGGVDMCIPTDLKDEKAKLDLKAGQQTLNGEQSLAYVRSRYAQGDGSDLGRIERQQEFMGAMLRKVTSGDILSSPTTLYDFLGSVTNSITTDDGLTVDTMADIAIAMREADMSNIRFITVPNGPAPQDPNRIAWTEPDASQLFQAIAEDADLSGGEEESSGGSAKKEEEPEESAPAVEPSQVAVEVVNGTGVSGLASEVATALGAEGFQVVGTGNPMDAVPEQTTVYYGTGQEAHAQTLADALQTATITENPALGTTVQLVLAGDWNGVKGASSGELPESAKGTTAEKPANACG
ncbi:transcriptional attenuator, LytR family [Marinactinospora thermotolerans DSM 45154]|uniref:Transcriptional attenuator, LytR family n=1 Tax=Marinactinospora thermotolerans DSM 45154 TaxID=1122192 RepID=A0A1T4QM35_9ACTN|nr:transcriptional attenuator, LytR family [Marinactinospora thermotolerans DSM 45154]